jgi:hypothetical protein
MLRRMAAWQLFATLCFLTACEIERLTGPNLQSPPYIAVVSRMEAGTLPDPNVMFSYHLRDVSAGGTLDTTITLAPNDTLIISVRPATYEIELRNLPAKCVSRYGTTETLVVPEGINTAIHRFFISCNPPFAAQVSTFGGPDEFRFVWQLEGETGTQQTGFIERRSEFVIVNPLEPGDYAFSVYNMPRNCEVTSPGGRSRTVSVPPEGGVAITVAIVCSHPERRPSVVDFRWSYSQGTSGFYLTAFDPDGDVAQYTFDVTDCNGRSVLQGGEVTRGALQSWHTLGNQNAEIFGAVVGDLVGVTPPNLCAAVRVFDEGGNASTRVERVQTPPGAFQPQVVRYNAVMVGTTRLTTILEVSDPGGAWVGTAVALQLRDGLLGSADGKLDIGDYNNQGFPAGASMPEVEFGPGRRIASVGDVHGHILVLVDRMGRFRRLTDLDLFH